MKSIQAFLTIILVLLMVGMMPNLADAGKKKKSMTVTIAPDQWTPETTEEVYEIRPDFVTCSDSQTYCYYYFKLNPPKKAKTIDKLTYWYRGGGGGTSLDLWRCKMGEDPAWLDGIWYSDSEWEMVEVEEDLIGYPIQKGYLYYLRLYISTWDWAAIYGATVEFGN